MGQGNYLRPPPHQFEFSLPAPHPPPSPPTTFNSQLHICQLNREQKGNESIVSHPILSDLSFVYAALSENYKLFTYEVVNARAFSDMT